MRESRLAASSLAEYRESRLREDALEHELDQLALRHEERVDRVVVARRQDAHGEGLVSGLLVMPS